MTLELKTAGNSYLYSTDESVKAFENTYNLFFNTQTEEGMLTGDYYCDNHTKVSVVFERTFAYSSRKKEDMRGRVTVTMPEKNLELQDKFESILISPSNVSVLYKVSFGEIPRIWYKFNYLKKS